MSIIPESGDPLGALNDDNARILPPDFTLKEMIGNDIDIKQIFSPENIEKAQNVINAHKDSFLEWVAKDIQQLEAFFTLAAANVKASGPEVQKLAKTAFVIKSQAGTFGFSLATQVAGSLDDFCNNHFHPTQEHLTVIRKHIDVISLIFQKNISGDGAATGMELTENLDKLVNKYKGK